MIFSVSNLILLLPVASALAIILSLSGSVVLRPRADAVQTFLRIVIWQMILLVLIGLLMRLTVWHILWALIMLGFLTSTLFWERSLARNSILLAILACQRSPARLNGLVHYLSVEGRGYWRRLGIQFGKFLRLSGDWKLALSAMHMTRDARSQMALSVFAPSGNTEQIQTQILRSVEEQRLVSVWLGRLVAASLSYLVLLRFGFMNALGYSKFGTLGRMSEEFEFQKMPMERLWQALDSWYALLILPLMLWGILALLYLLKNEPILARQRPMVALFGGYYRSLALEALAERLKQEPQADVACAQAAAAIPVRRWSDRLDAAGKRIAAGVELPIALRSSHLLREHELPLLSLSQDRHSLAWAVHEISQVQLKRLMNRLQAFHQVAVVVLVLISALLTALIAFMVLGTLTSWIDFLTIDLEP